MENKNLDFSVIVCCYNSDIEKLKKTIISIAKQKDVSFEIIISDDGSKNNNREEIEKWVELNKIQNIKYNFLEKNVGTLENIISASEIADGRYLKTFSPGDYLYDENVLKTYLDMILKKDYAILFSKAVYFTSEGKVICGYNPIASGTCKKLFLKNNFLKYADSFLGATIALKKEIIKYYKQLVGVVRLLEDYPVTYLSLLNNEKIGFINKNLVWYECDTGVSTANNGTRLENEYYQFFEYLLQIYKDNKKIKKNVKVLKVLRKESKFKKLIKVSLLRPSFVLYFLDYQFTSLFRKIAFKLKKIDANKIKNITNFK